MPAQLRAPALAGAGVSLFTHTQSVALAVWTVNHNLGHYPAGVTVRLASGEIVEPDRQDINVNSLTLSFISAVTGIAEVI